MHAINNVNIGDQKDYQTCWGTSMTAWKASVKVFLESEIIIQ